MSSLETYLNGVARSEEKRGSGFDVAAYEVLFAVLNDIGVPAHLLGWECLFYAIPCVAGGMPIWKTYDKVAYQLGTSSFAVERNIRTAAQSSVDRLGVDGISRVYGNTLSPEKGVPTNAHLLVAAARMYTARLAAADAELSA